MYIVTGGAGFIGSNLVKGLNDHGIEDIIIVDNLNCGNPKWHNLRDLVYYDYCNKDKFLKLLNPTYGKHIKGVFHMGACSNTREQDYEYLISNNYEFTKTLTRFCVRHGIRFINASSAATYGDGSLGFDDNIETIENLRPLNMYGYTKHMCDLWFKHTQRINNLVSLKFFNVYGPKENHKDGMYSVVLKAFKEICEYGKVALFKSYNDQYQDGEQLRDFIYVKDVVEMMIYFLENTQINGLFNIGTGVERSFNDLVKATFVSMGLKPEIEYVAMPEDLKDKYQYYTKAPIKRLLETGYNGKIHTLEEGVQDYIDYLVEDKII